MGLGPLGPAARPFRHLLEGRSIVGETERQLLRRYLDRRDEVAFEALVARHGPMVLGVCRRLLLDDRDVEDAFQATFLVLARKGGTLGERDPVGRWLYGVARRVALRARASAARRRRLEGSHPPAGFVEGDDPARRELAGVIDEELARLPERYRSPVVLCYLQGHTHDEAAHLLDWPLGTVKGRLARARDLLKGRLERRGIAPAGLIALFRSSRAAVPRRLVEFATRAAGRSAGMVPAGISTLVAGSLSTMFLDKVKVAGMAVLVLGTGAAVMAYQLSPARGQARAQVERPSKVVAPGTVSPPAEVADWVAGWPELTGTAEADPKTKAILKALDEPLAMNFPNDTPVLDVIKYIQAATERPDFPKGIPIYVDPRGLKDSDKTLADTVSIVLEGVPLKTSLKLALRQLTLVFRVEDGVMIISSSVAPDDPVTPFSLMEAKAERGELTREQYRQLIEALKLKAQVYSLTHPGHSG